MEQGTGQGKGQEPVIPESVLRQPVISVRGATATLGSRPVLRGIDLAVHRGEVVALLGANGSGKSTAVRAVIGQVPLTSGGIELFGTPLGRFRQWARIGYVPQRTTAAAWGARDGPRGRLLRATGPYEAAVAVEGRPGRRRPRHRAGGAHRPRSATRWARSPAGSTSGY